MFIAVSHTGGVAKRSNAAAWQTAPDIHVLRFPPGTSAGVLIALGNDDRDIVRSGARPLAAAVRHDLGVRMYESRM